MNKIKILILLLAITFISCKTSAELSKERHLFLKKYIALFKDAKTEIIKLKSIKNITVKQLDSIIKNNPEEKFRNTSKLLKDNLIVDDKNRICIDLYNKNLVDFYLKYDKSPWLINIITGKTRYNIEIFSFDKSQKWMESRS